MARPEIADPAVDELRRRARRRLVGAVVLALAAAVILPMLLEGEPKPLGNDVSIQIPPIDQGKFVTPLSPDKSSHGSDARAVNDQPPPNRALSVAEQRVLGRSGRSPSMMSSAPEAMRPQPVAAPPATNAAPAAKPDATPAGSGKLVVQVAALADVKAAEDMAAGLNKAGFPARVEPVATRAGPVQRVRVGSYASRDAAEAALANLKAAGYGSAMVTSQ